jgi:hypothetical protein
MAGEKRDIGISSGVDTGADVEKITYVDPTIEKHAHDADEAMKALGGLQGESIELDEATNRRLLSIIDWHMMPIMCFVYGMNYLDSMCIAFFDFPAQRQNGLAFMFCRFCILWDSRANSGPVQKPLSPMLV